MCPRTLTSDPSHFGASRLVPFLGVLLTIQEPFYIPSYGHGYTHLPVDYHHKVSKIRDQCARALYSEPKDLWIEYHFWHRFHFDFYHHLVYLKYINKQEPPVIPMKSIDAYYLGQFLELELKQVIRDLHVMGLDKLLEFRKPWNNELICQFYASYHLDSSGDFNTIHWTTEGQHYKVDFVTFSLAPWFGQQGSQGSLHFRNTSSCYVRVPVHVS